MAFLAGTVAFAATNVDDLFLLTAWFAAGRLRTRDIVLGQYAGIGLLFALSAAASLVSLAIPADWLRWLGLLPILIAARMLRSSRKPGDQSRAREARGFLPIATVTFANGSDNIGVYVPLFSTVSGPELAMIGTVFALMTALWCLAARWLVRHPAAGAPLRRWGPRAAPAVLIAIGLWILLR